MKIINIGKIDPSIKGVLEKLVTIKGLDFYVVGGLLCQYYLKDHARYTKDIDIIFNDEQQVVERELKKAFGDIHLFYSDDVDNFYGGTFTCFTRVNGLLGQIEGKLIKFYKDVEWREYSYEGIKFRGVQIEYCIAEKIVTMLNELERPYKHLVDLYAFSQIDQSLIDKKEIKRYMVLINAHENVYRKEHGLKEYELPKAIKEDKILKPPYVVPTLQSKYNVSREVMISSVNEWLKTII
jgi:predicted nucleotidyltransferase component of viral defense system